MKKAPQEKSTQGYLDSHSHDSRNNTQRVINRLARKSGLKALVDAKYCDYNYDELVPGTWRKQVENCWPLFAVRPMSGGV
jgi:hypothetical protein